MQMFSLYSIGHAVFYSIFFITLFSQAIKKRVTKWQTSGNSAKGSRKKWTRGETIFGGRLYSYRYMGIERFNPIVVWLLHVGDRNENKDIMVSMQFDSQFSFNQSTNLFHYASHMEQKLISRWGIGKHITLQKNRNNDVVFTKLQKFRE